MRRVRKELRKLRRDENRRDEKTHDLRQDHKRQNEKLEKKRAEITFMKKQAEK